MKARTEIVATYVHETEDAWVLDCGEGEDVWVPKSVCDPFDADIDSHTWEIEEWFALREGLI